MSAFTDEMTLGMNKIPNDTLERAYWRRRLPPGFRFLLELLARELLSNNFINANALAARLFEELLIRRDTELTLLPYESYFEKIIRRRGWESRISHIGKRNTPAPVTTAAGPQSHIPTTPAQDCGTCLRCARCGGFFSYISSPTPIAPAPAERIPASPVPQMKSQEPVSFEKCVCCGGLVSNPPSPIPAARMAPESEQLVSCARCGRKMKGPQLCGPCGATAGGEGPRPLETLTRPIVEDEYPKYNIIPLPYEKDAWGKLIKQDKVGEKDDDNISSRSLAILLDY